MRQEDGSYVVANRRYKPVGITRTDWVKYEEYPVKVKFKGLTKAKARKIDHLGREDLEVIYLYNDGCVPTDGDANWAAYAARLKVLAALKVVVME